jgi:predicted transposase YbfD/YdcC
VTSSHLRATLHEIEEHWTIEDVQQAHLALDLIEDAAVFSERLALE